MEQRWSILEPFTRVSFCRNCSPASSVEREQRARVIWTGNFIAQLIPVLDQ